jgi:hypothetical protein
MLRRQPSESTDRTEVTGCSGAAGSPTGRHAPWTWGEVGGSWRSPNQKAQKLIGTPIRCGHSYLL